MSSVLYVDDDPDDRALMAAACRRARVGFTLEAVESGEAALALLAARPAETLPAAVLLDLKMPGSTGFDVLRRLRADPVTRDLCVILYSSSMLAADVSRAHAEGASLFIAKPSAFADLQALAVALDRYVRDRDASALEARAWSLTPAPR